MNAMLTHSLTVEGNDAATPTAPLSVSELGARWYAARDRFLNRMDAYDARATEVYDLLPWPFVTYGKRRAVFSSADEIDRRKRLSTATKARLKRRLERAIAAYGAGRERYGLVALEAAVNAAGEEMGHLGEALAADRSGTPQAIVAKLRVLTVELEDGGDMSGYSGRLLTAALADAEAMVARPSEDLTDLHRRWSDIADWLDLYHNGPRDQRDGRYQYPEVYDDMAELADRIAAHPDKGLAATVIRLDVGYAEHLGAIQNGSGSTLEMLEEGPVMAGIAGLNALSALAPEVKPWTLQAHQRGLERLAAWRAEGGDR